MALRLKREKVIVKDGTDQILSAEATLKLQTEQIALKVEKQTFNALENSVEDQWAELAVQAMLISNKVSATDYNGNTIASLINQSASTVKVQAQHIQLEGLVTVNEKFKVLADGSIEAVNAKLSGAITATKMVATASPNYFGEIGKARISSTPSAVIWVSPGGNMVFTMTDTYANITKNGNVIANWG